jgi:hypothetical protein
MIVQSVKGSPFINAADVMRGTRLARLCVPKAGVVGSVFHDIVHVVVDDEGAVTPSLPRFLSLIFRSFYLILLAI